MTAVTELELPVFDYYEDTTLRGERYHETMRELAERSWLAQSPLAYFVLDREAATFFLRTKKATFPLNIHPAAVTSAASSPHPSERKNTNAPKPARKSPQRFICPSCNAEFPTALKFCGECGKPMAAAQA